MLNNKGQSLILFVMFLPIMLLILILIIDIGKIVVLKHELNNIADIVLNYGLDNIEDENVIDNMNSLLVANKNDIDKFNISIDNDRIYIDISENVDGMFSNFIDISIYRVNVSYVGYIENNKKIIEEKGD